MGLWTVLYNLGMQEIINKIKKVWGVDISEEELKSLMEKHKNDAIPFANCYATQEKYFEKYYKKIFKVEVKNNEITFTNSNNVLSVEITDGMLKANPLFAEWFNLFSQNLLKEEKHQDIFSKVRFGYGEIPKRDNPFTISSYVHNDLRFSEEQCKEPVFQKIISILKQ